VCACWLLSVAAKLVVDPAARFAHDLGITCENIMPQVKAACAKSGTQGSAAAAPLVSDS
jgi:hypothetical protein